MAYHFIKIDRSNTALPVRQGDCAEIGSSFEKYRIVGMRNDPNPIGTGHLVTVEINGQRREVWDREIRRTYPKIII